MDQYDDVYFFRTGDACSGLDCVAVNSRPKVTEKSLGANSIQVR